MSGNFPIKLDILAGKAEAVLTPGTAIAVADADFDVRFRGIEMSLDYPQDDENSKHATGDDAEDESLTGATSCTVRASAWVASSGSFAEAPAIAKYLKACGLFSTEWEPDKGVSWAPQKVEGCSTMTLNAQRIQRGATPGAKNYIIAGCMGNVTIQADGIGAGWIYNFEFKGKLVDIVDIAEGAFLELTGNDTAVAEKLLSNSFTTGGIALSISTFALDAGNVIEGQTDQSDATGYAYFRISERHPRFSCNPYEVPNTTGTIKYDFDAIVRAQTLGAISIASAATTPNYTISAPRAQLVGPGLSSREGDASLDFNYRLLRNTAGADAAAKEHTWELLFGAKE